MRTRARKLWAGLGAMLVILLAVLVARAFARTDPIDPFEPLGTLTVQRDRAARSLSEYIRIDTSTPPGIPRVPTPPHIRLLVERYVTPLGLEHEVLADRILLIRWPGERSELGPAVFLSHSDVVPVAEEELDRWTHPPFEGVLADGHVWGRGAIDNKGSTVCALEAIATLKDAGMSPRRDIVVLVVPDEEIGGEEGAGLVVREHLEALGDPAVVFDEGSFVVPDFLPGELVIPVAVGEKRAVTLSVTVQSEAGHASMPRAQDAPVVLAAALGRLAAHQEPRRLTAPMEVFLDRMSDRMPFMKRLVLKNRWLFAPAVWATLEAKPASNAMIRDTFAITVLRAGTKDNVVPAEARALLNVRLLPGSSLEEVISHLRETISDDRAQIEVISAHEPAPTSPITGDSFSQLERALVTAIPDSVVAPIVTPGSTDARYFARAGIPTYRLIPFTLDAEERQRMHGIDERVSVDNLEQAIRVYAHLMRLY